MAPAPQLPQSVSVERGWAPAPPKRGWRPIFLVPISVLVAGTGLFIVVGAHGRSSAARTVDVRPIPVPSAVGGAPLSTGLNAQRHAQEMVPILRKIFGPNAATSAQYANGAVNLLVGRGEIDTSASGDVALKVLFINPAIHFRLSVDKLI